VWILLAPLADAAAMDVSPYKPGQTLTGVQARELIQRYAQRKTQPWRASPAVATLKGRKDADLINYGIQVLDKTSATIGPLVEDKDRRYSGNNLNCSNCHLKGDDGLPGTRRFGIPFSNVMNDYPNFRARTMTVGTAADRVNGCMTRSMGNGRPLPLDSREMRAIIAYFSWLSQGTRPGMAMQGTGLPKLELPARPASPGQGRVIYTQFCASCHSEKATGTRSPRYDQGAGYLFPPLAGDDSFNNGAGMSRLITATGFIHTNMPLGTKADKPVLSVEEAYDVAAYIESLPRPNRPGRENDFPDPDFRPADYPVPAYFKGDEVALERARYGPFNSRQGSHRDGGRTDVKHEDVLDRVFAPLDNAVSDINRDMNKGDTGSTSGSDE
jgi:thiosulfate dehydrogenase